MHSKNIALGILAAGMTLGFASAGFAQSMQGTTRMSTQGTVNSTIGSAGPKGATGKAHSTANKKVRTEMTTGSTTMAPGAARSETGMRNSTVGSSGAATGMNGTMHSTGNKPMKPVR